MIISPTRRAVPIALAVFLLFLTISSCCDAVVIIYPPGQWRAIPSSPAQFGAPLSTIRSTQGEVFFPSATTSVACSLDAINEQEAPLFQGKIVVLTRGTCSFATKVLVAQKLGAQAVLIVNTQSKPTVEEEHKSLIVMSDDGNGNNVRLPVEMIANQDFLFLQQLSSNLLLPKNGLSAGGGVVVQMGHAMGPPNYFM